MVKLLAEMHVLYPGELGCSRLRCRIYFINTRQVFTFDVREDEMQTIKMASSDGSTEVDLPTGRITVDASVKPLAEYLALTFAIGVIFVTMRKPSYMLVTLPIDTLHVSF